MKIGIIGAGHMGSAMIKGWINSKQVEAKNISVKGGKSLTASHLQKELDFTLINQYEDLQKMDIIFLATPTPVILPVLNELAPFIMDNKIPVVSVSAGVSTQELQQVVPNHPVAQAIPNTPVQINQGVTGIVYGKNLADSQKEIINHSLSLLGNVQEVRPDNIAIFGTLAGCGPAFVDVFIEALGDGACLHGMDREMAYKVAASMIKGTAELLLRTQDHPAQLKDNVASPGGTTIKGLVALEKEGFRYATIQGINTIMSNE